MTFNLNHTPAKPDFEINHQQSLFLIGSCFSENIGQRLQRQQFNALSNPAGTLFNPLSIANYLKHSINAKPIPEEALIQRGGWYYSYLHHSSVNAATKDGLKNLLQQNQQQALEQLRHAHFLFITFGTAYYYHHKSLNFVVANCHKQPLATFEKKLMSVDEIVTEYLSLISLIKSINPEVKLIFTVSPVKHLRDGVVENNLSKAHLIISTHQLVQQVSNAYYFPAFELINDDLRDYRFYAADMAHPNEQAIDYVWEIFSDTYFSEGTRRLNKLIQKYNTALAHRSMNNDQAELARLQQHLAVLKSQIAKERMAMKHQ